MGDDAKKIEAIKRVPIMAEHYSTQYKSSAQVFHCFICNDV